MITGLLSTYVGDTLSAGGQAMNIQVRGTASRLMARLTQRQRQTLTALGFANLIALVALGVLLLRPTPPADDTLTTSPLNPQHLDLCRRAISRALLEFDQSGMVHTREDGTILLQLQRAVTTPVLRQDADAAIWTALEAIARHNECLGFSSIEITVTLGPSVPAMTPHADDEAASRRPNLGLHATARVDVADLMRWSLGELDDAELSLRVDYHPPTTRTPISPEATTSP